QNQFISLHPGKLRNPNLKELESEAFMASHQSDGKLARDEPRPSSKGKSSRPILKTSRSKTEKKKYLSDVMQVASSRTTKEDTRPKHESTLSTSESHWSSRPLSEYVIQEPIPDLNKLALDKVVVHNIFQDVP
ncbi:hypothetical protein Pfo_000238, partial [Paulownia fortunei]